MTSMSSDHATARTPAGNRSPSGYTTTSDRPCEAVAVDRHRDRSPRPTELRPRGPRRDQRHVSRFSTGPAGPLPCSWSWTPGLLVTGIGCDLLPLVLMIRGVLSPVLVAGVDR